MERMHEVPVGISGEEVFEVELLGVDAGVHGRSMPLVMFTVKCYLLWRGCGVWIWLRGLIKDVRIAIKDSTRIKARITRKGRLGA